MDHFAWNFDAGFAGDEDDASPITLLHSWQIRSAQTYSAHKVQIHHFVPLLIRYFLELFRDVESDAVNQNIDCRHFSDHSIEYLAGRYAGPKTISQRPS